MENNKDRLLTKNYIFVCMSSFMISFAFYILVPTLPFYLRDTFETSQTMTGIVLSCYVVAVLSVRPLAGFVADTFSRKGVYIISYIFFVGAFVGYFFITASLIAFIFLRIFHGLSFGMLSTTGNTLVIDVMPSSRRGEGLGYYGVVNNLAMAFGPMVGLFLVGSGDYFHLFLTSLLTGITGLLVAAAIKTVKKPLPQKGTLILSSDRFFLKEGIRACVSFFLLAIPYGMTTSYVAIYASKSGLTQSTGLFFTIMAAGLITSRLHSGKQVDKGYITSTIRNGIAIALVAALLEASLSSVAALSLTGGYVLYFLTAFLFGYGFGTIFPAYNTLFINLAPNSRRATANATYLTGWDVGIGCGMLIGGALAEYDYAYCYIFGAVLILSSLIFFHKKVTPHFEKYRLR